MSSYFIVLLFLLGLSIACLYLPKHEKIFSSTATLTMILFAGLRYETGYDWLTYGDYFKSIVGLKDALCNGIPSLPFRAEILYKTLNIALKSFTSNLSVLFLILATSNMLLMHFVLRKISLPISFTWLLYFGVGYIPAQMATIRQAMASALIMLCLWLITQSKLKSSMLSFAAALGFQISAVLFTPAILLCRHFPSKKSVGTILALGALCITFRLNFTKYVFYLVNKIPLPLLNSKISLYSALPEHAMSFGASCLVLFHGAILGLLLFRTTESEKKSPFVIIATWLTLITIIAHLYFPQFPIVWNRIMLVSIPWQISTLYSLKWCSDKTRVFRLMSLIGIFAISATSLTYTLLQQKSLPLVPYYSLLDGDVDGKSRSLKFLSPYTEIDIDLRDPELGPRRILFEPAFKKFFDQYCAISVLD